MISFERPASLTESEMRAWITERAHTRQLVLALDGPDRSGREPPVLRVEVEEDSLETAEEQLTELMLDMRLLGLRPVVLSPGRRASHRVT
jgi:hypothetical protein